MGVMPSIPNQSLINGKKLKNMMEQIILSPILMPVDGPLLEIFTSTPNQSFTDRKIMMEGKYDGGKNAFVSVETCRRLQNFLLMKILN